mmetsp:Transcript_20277/g.24227  ORF Transcript_20277/g.24227 Transcript_20277/m.24227 type:complete len:236 (+) Transcript_20277:108-815(+)|eukprot:CAMPEP_0197846728 /NCGR_PEP_ID=MMETSP1438-20131217/4206_1 /TAXON_ID=1461541 /ORGANISM="Pterosperma sp., Strain CCMP1384" /LENGTH=235 /DNA_ID=CAMNT_0043458475 /DNA_START=107 /DNA_END=814 /DNA_ORIENTATION=+
MLRVAYNSLGPAARRAALATLAPFEQLGGSAISKTNPTTLTARVSNTLKNFSTTCRAAISERPVARSVPVGLSLLLVAETSKAFHLPCTLCDATTDDSVDSTDNSSSKEKNVDDEDNELIDMFVEKFGKFGMKLGFGGCLGLCAGYSAKQLGKAAMLVVGAIFSLLQLLAYNGFIEIKWQKLKSYLESLVDMDKDGKFSSADLKTLLVGTLRILKHNLPGASGFIPGFYLGFTQG